jgi:uncharacterized protein YbaP (TraB family)
MSSFLRISLTLLAPMIGFGQEVLPSAIPDGTEKSLLWKISGQGLSEPSYLYGTIHLIDQADFFLSDSTRSFIDASDMVVFEVNMADMTDIGAQIGLLMDAFMDGGQSLKDLLPAEDYQLVKDHFQGMGLPIFLFERMKPMFLTVFTSMDLEPDAMSSGDMVSYEMKILELARAGEKRIGGLETIEYQMSIFDSIPYEEQAQMLVESIRSEQNGGDALEELVRLYKSQDIDAMVGLLKTEEGMGKHEDMLLVNRNRNWIPVMKEMMANQQTFFAVGAGHLGGTQGVIRLLRQEGYTVIPIKG